MVSDGFYGSKVNGTWNGMIGELYRNEADLAAAQLTDTEARSKVVDFVAPYTSVPQAILLLKKQDLMLINFNFLLVLDEDFAWALFSFFIFGFFVIYFYEYISMRYQGRLEEEASNTKPLWMETFTYVSGITFQRDLGGRNPKGSGTRLTAVAVAFGMVVVMTATLNA